MVTAGKFTAIAASQLGTSEQPPGSNRVKYSDWYGMVGAWCGMFVSWCAQQSGSADVVPRFAYTPAGAAWFQQRGLWSREPRPGSVAFYDVAGMGRISHCGVVEAVAADGSWSSIEGNTNGGGSRTGGQVWRHRRSSVGTSRGGFGHPQWALIGQPPTSVDAPPTVRFGSSGNAVRTAQDALNGWLRRWGLPLIDVDGAFGPATRTAVVTFQRRRDLTADGIVGPRTWAALTA